MKVLVINCGSSSMKFTLMDAEDERTLARGQVERIGLDGTRLVYRQGAHGEPVRTGAVVDTYEDAVRLACSTLEDQERGVLASLDEVDAIGHRVVHGGEKIRSAVCIDDAVQETIRKCFSLAPLHNPPNYEGIEACRRLFPGVPQVAVFDTAFHQSMPEEAYLYAVPWELYERERLRRYGFHGSSHRYVAEQAAGMLGRPLADEGLRLITCHLGNGCSITAIRGGRVMDTSMGLTPLEGLVMGTRSGDVDPAILLHLLDSGMSPGQIDTLLNKQSGLLGLAGIGSSDMRDIQSAAERNDPGAVRALAVYVRRLVKYIGAYYALLDGLDAIVFTAGVGENSSTIRGMVCDRLGALGIRVDAARNEAAPGDAARSNAGAREISPDGAEPRVLVIPTNEELMIARETRALVSAPAA